MKTREECARRPSAHKGFSHPKLPSLNVARRQQRRFALFVETARGMVTHYLTRDREGVGHLAILSLTRRSLLPVQINGRVVPSNQTRKEKDTKGHYDQPC